MQSVNLYLPQYRPRREWLSLQYSLIGFAIFLAVLIGMQLHKGHQVNELNEQVAALELRESTLKQQIDELKKKTLSSDQHRLQKQAQGLRMAIDNRNAIKKIISGSSMGNQQGFSQHLYALGDKRPQDLVVNRFMLTRGGDYIELEGVTSNPSSVPLYVHQLQQSPVFSIAKFGLLSIKESGEQAHFRLSGSGAVVGDALQIHSRKAARK